MMMMMMMMMMIIIIIYFAESHYSIVMYLLTPSFLQYASLILIFKFYIINKMLVLDYVLFSTHLFFCLHENLLQ
jgi:hypothetical protein